MRMEILLLVASLGGGIVGCSHQESSGSSHARGGSITSLDMRPNAGGTTVTFETDTCRGRLTVEPGLGISSRTVAQTGSPSGALTQTVLTIAGHDLSVEGSRLRLGDRVIGPFSGDVKVEVKKDGVFVDGKKASDF
jgi:hypothetical protein